MAVRSMVGVSSEKPTGNRCSVSPFALIAALLWSAAAAAQPAPAVLTEAEAIRLGLERAALQDVLQGEAAAARSDVVRAGLWPNPSVAYAREQTYGGSLASGENYAWLTQRFDLSGRRGFRVEAAEKRVHAAEAGGEARRQQFMAEIRARFFEVLYLQLRAAVLEKWLSEVRAVVAVVTKREAAGDVAGYDRQRVAREEAAAQARVRAEAAALARGRERLMAVTGVSRSAVGGELRVVGDLLPDAPPPLETLVDAVAKRADLQALAARAGAAEVEVRAAARWWVPEVLLGGGFKSVEAGGERATGFTALGEIPLPLFDRSQAMKARAQAELQIIRGELELERAKAVGDTRGLYAQAVELVEAARAARGGAQDSLRLGDIATAGYRGGELGILELLDAYRSVLDASVQAFDLEWNARVARIELDLVTGGVVR